MFVTKVTRGCAALNHQSAVWLTSWKTWSSWLIPPQDQGILDRVRVVIRPGSGHIKSQPLVEAPRRFVRPADLERGTPRAQSPRLVEDALDQMGADALTAKRRTDRHVVDMDLIHDQPEGAEPGNALFRRPDDEDVADRAILQLPGVHLLRPRIGE